MILFPDMSTMNHIRVERGVNKRYVVLRLALISESEKERRAWQPRR